jgi:cytochrome oxidase Cu insertion factor (SCO1/SenC/PrrC family)/plastocyanin
MTLLVLFLFLGISGTTHSFAEDKWADELPKVTLKTQDNKTVRFYEDLVKGKIVIINFMYTQCKTTCETGTMNLLQVQKALGDDLGRNVFIYSISIDPEHDSPAVLKAYAEAHGVKPGWTFLTGNIKDITALRDKLGLTGLSPELRQKLGLPKKVTNSDVLQRQHSGMILIANEPFNRRERVKILSTPDSILQVIEGMKPPKSIPKNMAAVVAASTMLASAKTIDSNTAAAEKAIEATTTDSRHFWQPNDISASVGDVVEWKLGSGTHGVRITNWAAVKDHVEVETVAGQQPFNATTGRNDNSTNTAGRVLLRLKINSVPPAPSEITYNCIVHGNIMRGKVSLQAGTTPTPTPSPTPTAAPIPTATPTETATATPIPTSTPTV